MSTASPRGPRTRGIFIGTLANHKRDPKPERQLRVARAYCARVEVAVLALVAEEIGKSGKDANEVTIAYEAARAAYTPRSNMPLAADMAGDAALGRKWTVVILAETRRYADYARIEGEGPAIPAIKRWLENFGKAAAELVAAYNEPLDPLDKIVARADLGAHMPLGADLDEFMIIARAIVWAAPAVVSAMDDDAGCIEGVAWDRWIVALTKFCREAGLPYSVTHDPELRSDERQSEFVLLVAALMKELPRSLRRHDKNYGTLAHYISRARNAADKRRQSREEQEAHSAE